MSRRLLGGSDEPCCDRDIGHRSGRGALLVRDTDPTVSLTQKSRRLAGVRSSESKKKLAQRLRRQASKAHR
jgi:hypothetical protein